MNNKERYKQAFSALHPSAPLSLEVEEMAKMKKKHKTHMAVAAAVAAAVIIGGSGTVYAADIGGIQEKLSMWFHGSKTEVNVTGNGDGGYTFSWQQAGEEHIMGSGGVSIDESGNETWLTAQELVEDMNQYAEVWADPEGKVHVYYYDQEIDVTDLFDQDNICRLLLTHEGKPSYLKITRETDGSYPFSQSATPEDDAALYLPVSD